MYDRISRAAAIDAIPGSFDAIRAIKELPAVDATPVVYRRWIDENPDDPLDPRMRCSICSVIECPLLKWRYCPNCGAKMRKE